MSSTLNGNIRWYIDSDPRDYQSNEINNKLNAQDGVGIGTKIKIGELKCKIIAKTQDKIVCETEIESFIIELHREITTTQSQPHTQSQTQLQTQMNVPITYNSSKTNQNITNTSQNTSNHSPNYNYNSSNYSSNVHTNSKHSKHSNQAYNKHSPHSTKHSSNTNTNNSNTKTHTIASDANAVFQKNVGLKLVTNHGGWNFVNDEGHWVECQRELRDQLNNTNVGGSFDYCYKTWNYKITKINENYAQQLNKLTYKKRDICRTEYIPTFDKNKQKSQKPPKSSKSSKNGNKNHNNLHTTLASIYNTQSQSTSKSHTIHNKTSNNNHKNGTTQSIADILPLVSNNCTQLEQRAKDSFRRTMKTTKFRIVQTTDLLNNRLIPQNHIDIYNTIFKSDPNHREIYCFHGTASDNVDFIIQNGFDRSFNKHSLYGKGVYLAKNASLSVSFCEKSKDFKVYQGHLCMFFCKAIVGDYVIGKTDQTAHYKEDGKTQYTTLVDSLSDPKVYVMTKDFYVLPLVLIQFERVGGSYHYYN